VRRGFPTSMKWDGSVNKPIRQLPSSDKADESEPGTIKDRFYPQPPSDLVIEGMALAWLVTGSKRGHSLYRTNSLCRAEIFGPKSLRSCAKADLLGKPKILGSDLDCNLEFSSDTGMAYIGVRREKRSDRKKSEGPPRRAAQQAALPGQMWLWQKPKIISLINTLTSATRYWRVASSGQIRGGGEGDYEDSSSSGQRFMVEHPGVFEDRWAPHERSSSR